MQPSDLARNTPFYGCQTSKEASFVLAQSLLKRSPPHADYYGKIVFAYFDKNTCQFTFSSQQHSPVVINKFLLGRYLGLSMTNKLAVCRTVANRVRFSELLLRAIRSHKIITLEELELLISERIDLFD